MRDLTEDEVHRLPERAKADFQAWYVVSAEFSTDVQVSGSGRLLLDN